MKKELTEKEKELRKEKRKEIYQKNKEKEINKVKEYQEKNKEKIKEYKEKNKEKIKEYNKIYLKEYREKNKKEKKIEKKIETIKKSRKEYFKEYREKNKEKKKEYLKAYREKNKENRNQNRREKRLKDPLYKLKDNLRSSIYYAFKNKGYTKESKTHEILDCSFEDFKLHLEKQFIGEKSWMNWENYGNPKDGIFEPNKTWDIDHIIPLASATTEEEIIKLNHYTNLQPLCSYENRFIKMDNL